MNVNTKTRKIGIAVILASSLVASAFAVEGGGRLSAPSAVTDKPCTTTVSEKEIGFILKDATPETKRKMVEPAFQKKQFENLREMFAIACQAGKEGMTEEPDLAEMLRFLMIEITARGYDRTMYKTSDSTRYQWIADTQIDGFYNDSQNLSDFESFRSLARRMNPETTGDEAEMRRDFANIVIAYRESLRRANELPAAFREGTDFAVRIGQSQFLFRQYTERVLNPKTRVADTEIDAYIAARPQYSTTAKKALAERILKRAQAGGNFAVLARTYSNDPGSRAAGGRYANVELGKFVPEFEKAALALAPGDITPQIVESSFGFHIIKLERKGETRDANGDLKFTFDVRHILISTMVKDPSSPAAAEVPMRDFVRTKLEDEREMNLVAAIIAANPVTIAGEMPAPAKPVIKPRPRRN